MLSDKYVDVKFYLQCTYAIMIWFIDYQFSVTYEPIH